jgi:hypothetical protein
MPDINPNMIQVAGLGLYWIIVEMLNETTEKKLSLSRIGAIAMQSHCDCKFVQEFIDVCSKSPIDLFTKNGEFFWSESVLRRASIREKKKDINRKNALNRKKTKFDETDEHPSLSDGKATAQPNEAKKEINKRNKEIVVDEKEPPQQMQSTKLFAIWGRAPDNGERARTENLLKQFGYKPVWEAFHRASEMGKEKKNVAYVKGILTNPDKTKSDKFARKI